MDVGVKQGEEEFKDGCCWANSISSDLLLPSPYELAGELIPCPFIRPFFSSYPPASPSSALNSLTFFYNLCTIILIYRKV
jgi:hypothetical protein